MGYAEHLKDLLEPLGIYRWDGSFQWNEIQTFGEIFDACAQELEDIQTEMHLMTAQNKGLEQFKSLLAKAPATQDVEQTRNAIIALLRIGDRSFTPKAIQDNLNGCGLSVKVEEIGLMGAIGLSFPGVAGEPDGFQQIKSVIESIIPCHIEIDYDFIFVTWAILREKSATWRHIAQNNFTWKSFETWL